MGALGGARATLTRYDALARAVRFTGVPVFRTWQPLTGGRHSVTPTATAMATDLQKQARVSAQLSDRRMCAQ